MLDSEVVQIHESIHTVCQTRLLVLVEFGALDVARDTLGPADLRKLMGF